MRHWANDIAICLSLVAAGQGVVLMPSLARADRDDRVAVRRLADAAPGRTIYAFTRRSAAPRPALRALVDALRAAGATAG